jgi:hypothetical protein
MTPAVQVGSILLEKPLTGTSLCDVKSQLYWGNWALLEASDSGSFDSTVRESGWNFFFMAEELKASFYGAPQAKKVAKAVKRIMAEMRPQNFNGLEITGIVAKRFLGIPYATVSAHPRHLQQGWYLDSTLERCASQRATAAAGL